MSKYFYGHSKHPQGLSVGAIVLNSDKRVCAHRFTKEQILPYVENDNISGDIYLLMRETIEDGESLEKTLERGLREEFGIKARLIDYVGSITSKYSHDNVDVQKTTVYFLCGLINQDDSKRESKIEGQSEIVWMEIDELIEIMKNQSKSISRTDVDESFVLERVKKLYKSV